MSQATLAQAPAAAAAAPVNPNKALWEKGDFTRIARTMRESGDALVRSLDVQPGMQVLDLGCGDGTTAVPSAQLGAQVLGVDISTPLVQAGNRRAQNLGLTNLHFQEGDASHLQGIGDQRFDLLVSIFGAMFAPRPFDVAKEMVRVVRSGGRIVMGNWIPGDPTLIAQVLKICSAYSPPPPAGFISPVTWGVEANVTERFVAAGVPESNIAFERATYTFTGDLSPAEFLSEFRYYYGPTMNAFAAAEQQGKAEDLQRELAALFERENRNPSKSAMTIPATFLKVTVTRP